MGSIDRSPRVAVAEKPDPSRPKPIPVPRRSLSLVGVAGIGVGVIIFAVGAMQGWNLILMGLGCAFIWAGPTTRERRQEKLCPACRMAIPLEAGVCAFCRLEQRA